MVQNIEDPKIASFLFTITLIATLVGIFVTIYYLFIDAELAYRIAAAVLVGIVGVISFIRHSVFYRSDQARMGWRQEHPEFQLEVGYANLAMGISAILAAGLNWGSLACGMTLFMYGMYLFCTFLLHVHQAFCVSDTRARAMKSVFFTGIFVIVLFIFAFLAVSSAHVAPF